MIGEFDDQNAVFRDQHDHADLTSLASPGYVRSFAAPFFLCLDLRQGGALFVCVEFHQRIPGPFGRTSCEQIRSRRALLAPKRLSTAITEIGGPLLQRDWSAFHACAWLDPQDETANAWFPAWYLLEHTDTRIASDATPLPTTPPAQAFVLIGRLIELERRGHSAAPVAARRQLRDLSPELFAFYCLSRK